MNTLTLNSSIFPLADISISTYREPFSMAMFFSIQPFAFISLSIFPEELSLARFFILFPLPDVLSWQSQLDAFYFHVLIEYTFKKVIFLDQNSTSMPFTRLNLSKVQK